MEPAYPRVTINMDLKKSSTANLTLATCIPVRNGRETIAKLIESIQDSSVLPDEIIVSDNCSVDGTPSFLNSLFGNSIRLSLNQRDIGFDNNLVKSVELSHCDYVWVLGDHCVLKSDAIELITKFIESRNYPDAVIVDFNLINGVSGVLIKNSYSSRSSPHKLKNLCSFTNSVAFNAYISCFIFKRSSFLACNFYGNRENFV